MTPGERFVVNGVLIGILVLCAWWCDFDPNRMFNTGHAWH